MTFHLLQFQNLPISDQLKLEEDLLRTDTRNWCIINEGSSTAIVMGISGKKEKLVNLDKATQDQIPILKRFSGGGTVIVDENTLFVTFICQKDFHPFLPFPEPIMRWTETFYKQAFAHPTFALRENDFVIDDKKIGGNAQYIKKDRWLHHTSFLWDYSDKNMDYLLHPEKTPQYRNHRSHCEFLSRLSHHFASRTSIITQIKETLAQHYAVIHCFAK